MAKKAQEPKLLYEREYVVPLRNEWLKVPKYKRANKAVKALKQFIARHMKIYDRDLRKIKIDIDLNNELRFRGMRKPLAKVKVLAKKYNFEGEDFVRVELVNVPEHIKFKRLREIKKKLEKEKKHKKEVVAGSESKDSEKSTIAEKTEEEKTEIKEKEQSSRDEGLKLAKMQAKQSKHIAKDKGVKIQRKALQK